MRPRAVIAAAGFVVALAAGLVAARDVGSAGSSAPRSLGGAGLFLAKGCATCHTGPDSASTAGVGPSLAAAASWAGERRAGMSAEAYLAESMRDPGAFRAEGTGGVAMPVLTLTDDEVDQLVDYLLDR